MTSEASVKRYIVDSMKEGGGYARRIEDQFAVGTYDMILIPRGLPVFTAEVKLIHDNVFGPTARQLIELQRVKYAASDGGHVIPRCYWLEERGVLLPQACRENKPELLFLGDYQRSSVLQTTRALLLRTEGEYRQ